MLTVLQQSVLCTHTHSTIGLCSSCQNATKHLMENQLIYCIIKNVIYKYPPSFLTLHAFYKLVCYTVLIEAMCAAIFPQKTTTTVCLGFCFHTSSMPILDIGQESVAAVAGVSNRNARGPPCLLSYIGQEPVAAVAGVSNRNARGPPFLLSYWTRVRCRCCWCIQ